MQALSGDSQLGAEFCSGLSQGGDDARVTSRMIRKQLAWRLTTTEISLSYMKDSIMTMTRLVYRPVEALRETDERL